MKSLDEKNMPFLTRVVDMFLRGDVAILLTVISLALGAVALFLTPREEEPQIVVPMADVIVEAPSLSAQPTEETERRITERLEKLLKQIDGVEFVYSMTQPGRTVATVRFYVGEDREDSLLKLYNKLHSNMDRIPTDVAHWVVKPVEVDDVPIVVLTLWSEDPEKFDDYHLRRVASQIQKDLQAVPNTGNVTVTGGRPRKVRVALDPVLLAARGTSPLDVAWALGVHNVNKRAGHFNRDNTEFIIDTGSFIRDRRDLEDLVVNVSGDKPVYLHEVVKEIKDGPVEPVSYSWMGFGPAGESESPTNKVFPAVHISIPKLKGTNAVSVAKNVHHAMEQLAETHLPEGVKFRVTRDYGETADAKVDELVEGLLIAVLTVVGLIGLVLGWRAALVVALAIPVCYSLTLFINLLGGYTINRVTMFAMILSLGLLVDDPITDVENIARYFAMKIFKPREAVLMAIAEVRPALILSTLAIIVSFLPLVFITGMMGPYMAPMAMNVPLTVTMSTIVAFLVTPWLAMTALRRINDRKTEADTSPEEDLPAAEKIAEVEGLGMKEKPIYRFYNRLLSPMLDRRALAWSFLGGVAVLFVISMMLPAFRMVPLKMLPYDNKNEFQVVIDMPESTTLEQTDGVARRLGNYLSGVAEVRDFQIYTGIASPMDFNGMVRHYFLRRGSNLADIRVNLAPKEIRSQQSHEILLRIRDDLTRLANEEGADVKLVEVPPGPPVLATITAEVYGPQGGSYDNLIKEAHKVERRLAREPRIVDVDTSADADYDRWVFITDPTKAALSEVSTEDVVRTIHLALDGLDATVMHDQYEVDPLMVQLRVPRERRSSLEDVEQLYVRGRQGQTVQIGSLGKFVSQKAQKTIYHKNLERVVFVYGEIAGRPPADAIIDMWLDRSTTPVEEKTDVFATPDHAEAEKKLSGRTWLTPGGGDPWHVSDGYTVQWAGEGEWKITLDVFRDLGLAFLAAQICIFVILMFQTGSRILPLVIMLAIPLTMIGIMPGFWILNLVAGNTVGGYPNPVFITATAMIGMIALSGIVVRNSSVLIDFIHHGLKEGMTLREAIISSAAIRTRPILLTAGTTLLGNWVITLDPIFSGLAWAIIFGIMASTIFTLFVIPVVYWLLYGPGKAESV